MLTYDLLAVKQPPEPQSALWYCNWRAQKLWLNKHFLAKYSLSQVGSDLMLLLVHLTGIKTSLTSRAVSGGLTSCRPCYNTGTCTVGHFLLLPDTVGKPCEGSGRGWGLLGVMWTNSMWASRGKTTVCKRKIKDKWQRAPFCISHTLKYLIYE